MNIFKLKKSHISIFLAFIIFTMSFSWVYADANSVNTTEATKAFDFLKSVGVIPQDEIFSSDTNITRAYFSYLAVLLSGYSVNSKSPVGQVFSDVNSGTQYAPYIEAANKLGFIHGSDGNFNPEEKITLVQAIKIITHILGYENYASVYGGYPTGYVYLAGMLDLTDGLQTDSNTYLNSSDALLLLKNAANTEIMQLETIKGDNFSLNTAEGETLLYKNHGIACVDGIIEANGYTNLYYEESELTPNQISIGSVIFNDPKGTMQDYIGLNVRLFYDYRTSSSVKDAKYAYVLDENSVIKLAPDEINVSNGKITYYEGDMSEKTVTVSPTASCIVNGKMTGFAPDDLLSVEKGSIEFISNNSDRITDVIKIKKYTTFVVKAASAASGIIIANDGSRFEFDDNSAEYDFEILKNNSEASLEDIKSGDIILVSEGVGKGYRHISILACDKNIKAVFDEIGDGYAVIGGEKYNLDTSVAEGIKIGNNYKICFDSFNNVSYIEVENDMVYGFLYGISKQGIQKPQCRIFTENDRWVTLDFADKVKYNNISVTSEKLYSQLNSLGDGYKKLIRYNVNEAAQLIRLESYVEIPIGDDNEDEALKNNVFRLSYSGSATYRYTPKSFTGKFFVDSNTKVFAVPQDLSEENFKVRTISSLNSDNSYSVNAFNINENLYSNVITIPAFSIDTDVSYTDRFTVVKSKGQIVNIKGEAAPSLRCWRNGNEVAFPVTLGENGVDTDTYNSLKQGDVVQFKYDEDNNIVYLKKYPVESFYYTSGNHYSSSVVIGASVKGIDISGKRLRLVYTDSGDELGVTYTSTTTATLWDKKAQTCTDADVSEIIPGDIIFATMRYHVCYDIMIIRN